LRDSRETLWALLTLLAVGAVVWFAAARTSRGCGFVEPAGYADVLGLALTPVGGSGRRAGARAG
jgi:hypothetical protein